MRKIILLIAILLLPLLTKAQTIVFNKKLMEQLTKNQAVRLTSNNSLLNSYKKQRELYDKINNRLTEIAVIQEYIYSQLTNINSLIKDGKKAMLFGKYVGIVTQNLGKLTEMTVENPHFATLRYEYYIKILDKFIALKDHFENEVMHEKHNYLVDQYDRQLLVGEALYKIKEINSFINYLIFLLEYANQTSIYHQIPILGNYIILDKSIVNDIMYNLKHRF
ncbi:MAG: hypothetical protein WDA08_02225 [Weeksellaceae bacterium]